MSITQVSPTETRERHGQIELIDVPTLAEFEEIHVEVMNVLGGMTAWKAVDLPTVREQKQVA